MNKLVTKYLTFSLNQHHFAVDTRNVLEIILNPVIYPIPGIYDIITGVINFRGEIISVFDYEKIIGIDKNNSQNKKSIIVIEFGINKKKCHLACQVDKVKRVINLPNDIIQPVPEFGLSVNIEFLLGLFKHNQIIYSILNIEKFFYFKM